MSDMSTIMKEQWLKCCLKDPNFNKCYILHKIRGKEGHWKGRIEGVVWGSF